MAFRIGGEQDYACLNLSPNFWFGKVIFWSTRDSIYTVYKNNKLRFKIDTYNLFSALINFIYQWFSQQMM